jgi:hypothetical protein
MTTTTFTNAIANAVGTAEVVVFTAADKSIVIGCSVSNLKSTTIPFTIKMRRGSADTYVHKDKRIEAGEPFELMKGNKLVLNAGDKLIVSALVDSSLDVVFSILQGVS